MMTKISLREALPLVSQIEKMIREKQTERAEKAVIEFQKGEKYEKTDEVDRLTEEIARLQSDLRKLQLEIQKANLNHLVNYTDESGRKLTLAEALILAKHLREELERWKSLASKPDKPRMLVRLQSGTVMQVASFDVNAYKEKIKALSRKVNRLSSEIERANFDAMIDFDASHYIETSMN